MSRDVLSTRDRDTNAAKALPCEANLLAGKTDHEHSCQSMVSAMEKTKKQGK